MQRRFLGTVAAAALFALVGALPTSAASTVSGRLLKTSVHEVLPMHGGTASSLNWSGYAVTPGSGITGVTSQFTVPAAGLVPPGFTATWTGIGGYTTSDLIQAGVSENSALTGLVSGGQYNAWFEILPASETPLTNCSGNSACTVQPGDVVTVSINLTSTPNVWDVSLKDPAEGWSWEQDVNYQSSESSAEWILEAPTVAVQTIPANTGTAHFGTVSTYTDASGTHPIGDGHLDPTLIDMGPGIGVNEATPSALGADNESFNDCTYAQSCPAP